jgi:2-desacetyl-2-hydroxyethyl bacteriochlorophyllide A dehydrogenase
VSIETVTRPRLARGEARVRVRNCGICGSDLHWFLGGFPPPPVCPGHEIAGEIVELTSDEGGLHVGQRVAVEPLVVCRECSYCRTGDYQLCPHLQILGTSRHGGFAEELAMPMYALYPLPDGLDFEVAALAEPLAVCVHGVRLARVALGDRVLVLGAGSIGLLSVLAARAAGAQEVAVTARYPQQAEMARRLGATHVFGSDTRGTQDLDQWSAGNRVDRVIETVGATSDTIDVAVGAVRRGGTVVLLGVFTQPPRCPALALLVKEVRLVGSLTYGRVGTRADFEVAIQLLARAPAVREMITHRVHLADLQAGLETAADKSRGAIKVTVTA